MPDLTMRLYDHALRVSGASLRDRAAALFLFRQGMDAGRFGGDELRSVLEHCPYLVTLLQRMQGNLTIHQMKRDGVDAEEVTRILHIHRAIIEADSAAVPQSYEEQGADLVAGTHALMNSIRAACGIPTKTLQ